MAFTRQMYGNCATKKRTEASTSILSYLMDPNKHYNCNPCRIELGVVGGNDVSLYEGNMVDLSSELSGRTRKATDCPSGKFLPGTVIQGSVYNDSCSPDCGANGLPCGSAKCHKKHLVHLPGCSIVDYKPRVNDVGYELNYPPCASMGYTPDATPGQRPAAAYAPADWQGQQGVDTGDYAKY